MPLKVELLPGEPIAVVTASGALAMDEIEGAYEQVTAFADQWGGTVYAVYDMTRIDVAWGRALAGMSLTVKQTPGSPSDERVLTLMVATSNRVKRAAEAVREAMWGGLDLKVFDTEDAAVGYARASLEMASQGWTAPT